jgi:competence protein ComEC
MTRDKIFLMGESAFMVGIFLYPYFRADLWALFLLAGLMLALIFLVREGKLRILLIVSLFFAIGLMRFSLAERDVPSDRDLEETSGKEIKTECRVAGIPEFKDGKQRIVLEPGDSAPFKGKVLVYTDPYGEYAYGDRVILRGKLAIPENFEDFDYRGYLRGKGIYLISYYPSLTKTGSAGGFYGLIYSIRGRADENIGRILPSPAGNIVSAMTLGTESEETEEVMEKFNKTGTSHVIAVSGYHMVIVAAILVFLLQNLGVGRTRRFYLVLFGIACFVILSGSQSSAIRSAIMAGVFLFATQIGRGGDALRALIFSAAAMIFFSPYILAGDIGFQLSFLATFGLVVILPVLAKRYRNMPRFAGIKEILLTTLAAQIAVFPVLLLNFGQFSLLSFLANILILPTVPLIMIGGFLAIGASFVNLFLAKVIAFPIYFLTMYEIEVVDILSRTDWGMIRF